MTTFLFARIFVASSLSKIQELVQYVKDLDIHKLTMPVPLSGPEDDEIRIIAQTLQSSLDTIKIQTDSLKDFVSYASHELKTPLATIR
jgi:signal transduction histidine kinase